MSDHDPVKVHVVKDDTSPPPPTPNVVGTARIIAIRQPAFGDGPVPILSHNPKRIRAYISPISWQYALGWNAALGLVWCCNSESDAQQYTGYPLISGIPGGAGTPSVDGLEIFSTTELWGIPDAANTLNVLLRVWTEVKS